MLTDAMLKTYGPLLQKIINGRSYMVKRDGGWVTTNSLGPNDTEYFDLKRMRFTPDGGTTWQTIV